MSSDTINTSNPSEATVPSTSTSTTTTTAASPPPSEPTISTLERITAPKLSTLLQQQHTRASPSSSSSTTPPLAIIDVRDADHIGGHIRTSQHIPSTALEAQLPTLVRSLRDVPVVVFHCALSQQRGPKAALGYLRQRRRWELEEDEEEREDAGQGKEMMRQQVLVLEGGFHAWQELYGEDKSLTEAYVRDLWRE